VSEEHDVTTGSDRRRDYAGATSFDAVELVGEEENLLEEYEHEDVVDDKDVELAVSDEDDAETAEAGLDEADSSTLEDSLEEVSFEQSANEPTESYEDETEDLHGDDADEDLSLR
jgi:hypothetical protein